MTRTYFHYSNRFMNKQGKSMIYYGGNVLCYVKGGEGPKKSHDFLVLI